MAQARNMSGPQVAAITGRPPSYMSIVESAGNEARIDGLTGDTSLFCWRVASGVAHARLWASLSSVLDRTDLPGTSSWTATAMRLSASDGALAVIAGVTTSMIGAGWRLYDERRSDPRRSAPRPG